MSDPADRAEQMTARVSAGRDIDRQEQAEAPTAPTDPTATNHPVGEDQARENGDNESPG